MLSEFPNATMVSKLVAQLEELMGRMNSTSYWLTAPHLWLVGKIPSNTWDNFRQTSERKSQTHSCDQLIDLLIKSAMERQNDLHMDKYV